MFFKRKSNHTSAPRLFQRESIIHYTTLLAGAAILSFGLHNIHSQSQITEGGVLGMTLLLHHWTGISPGIFSFVLDMTCYALGFKLLGAAFLKSAIFASTAYALFFRLWESVGYVLPPFADRPFLAAILGGLFVGIGVGLIVRRGGASGGDDALALIIRKITGWKISRAYFFTDFTVLMLSLSYIPFRKIFFSLLTVMLSSAIIELIQSKDKETRKD